MFPIRQQIQAEKDLILQRFDTVAELTGCLSEPGAYCVLVGFVMTNDDPVNIVDTLTYVRNQKPRTGKIKGFNTSITKEQRIEEEPTGTFIYTVQSTGEQVDVNSIDIQYRTNRDYEGEDIEVLSKYLFGGGISKHTITHRTSYRSQYSGDLYVDEGRLILK